MTPSSNLSQSVPLHRTTIRGVGTDHPCHLWQLQCTKSPGAGNLPRFPRKLRDTAGDESGGFSQGLHSPDAVPVGSRLLKTDSADTVCSMEWQPKNSLEVQFDDILTGWRFQEVPFQFP